MKHLKKVIFVFLASSLKIMASDALQVTWPVITVGGGATSTSQAGAHQTFPIVNPITDSFYIYNPNHSTQTVSLFQAFFGAEFKLKPCLNLQAGLDYTQSNSFRVSGSLVQGADTISADSYTYSYRISSQQLLVASKLLFTFQKRFHPYLFAGVGAAINNAYHFSTNVPPTLTFTRMYSNNISTSFSYALGLGIDADINSFLRVGLGYRYTDFGSVKLGNATIDTTAVSGTLSQSHLHTNQFLLQVTCLMDGLHLNHKRI